MLVFRLGSLDPLLLWLGVFGRRSKRLNIRFLLGGRLLSSSGSVESGVPSTVVGGVSGRLLLRHARCGEGECALSMSLPLLSWSFVNALVRDIFGGCGITSPCPTFLFAIHFVLDISSRATGRTGTRGWWNAIFSQPFQLMSEGMN
jgi:hypothetical protein